MFDKLFKRLRKPAEQAAPAAPKAAPQATAPAAPPAAPVAIGARRPIVAADGSIAGFEFRMAQATVQRLLQRGDSVASAAHTNALLAAMRLTLASGRIAFAELPVAWLERPGIERELAPGMHIALQFPLDAGAVVVRPAPVPEAITRWRAAGVRLGWEPGELPVGEADFIVLRQHGAASEPLFAELERCRASHPKATIVVADLGGIDDLERALRQGANYGCCALVAGGEPRQAQPIPPQVQRLCQLLNRLGQGAPTDAVVADIKGDVALSYRLLRHLQSAQFGATREIGSIEQAVLLLGRDELYRWLSVLLVRSSDGRPTAQAVQEAALARARLLELLASQRGEAAPGALFTLGLASMLGTLLRAPDAQVLEGLTLSAPAREALLQRQGPWAAYLEVAQAAQELGVQMPDPLAAEFGGVATVMDCSHQAWAWAAEQAAGGKAAGG
jgi:hypothetical protein